MRSLNISQVDTVFANGSYPIELLFFYNYQIKTELVRKALSEVAKDFWPAFGKYDGGKIQFEHFRETDLIREIEIAQNYDSSDDVMSLVRQYGTVSPDPMPCLSFLTVIQFTNGTALIYKLNHLAGDGYSYFFLLAALAAYAQGRVKRLAMRAMFRPVHSRTILKEFILNTSTLAQPFSNENLSVSEEIIPRSEVGELVRRIAAETGQTVSTNDILSARALQQFVHMRGAEFGRSVQLSMPVDVRRKISDYGARYFGNGLLFARIEFETSAVAEMETAQLARHIRDNMPDINRESYRNYLSSLESAISRGEIEELRPYNPGTGILVTNLSKMPTEKIDFGKGAPAHVLLLTLGKNSTAILGSEEKFILRLAY
jgi:NRPS condensation-like uncharacterized protein